jgi:N-acetylmuramoyl-L-alanine amidase
VGQRLTIPSSGGGYNPPSSGNSSTYTVQPGDTLWKISQKFGVSVESIKSANGLWSDTLRVGQRLTIPSSGGGYNPPSSGNSSTYTVQPGDTLWKISQKFGVSVESIKSANGLWSNTVAVGQRLNIPTNGGGSQSPPTSGRYTVQEKNLLSRLISAEAKGEPFEGQVAVGGVVLNRVKSSLFPNTIPEVIYQPYQFSPVLDGSINMAPTSSAVRAMESAISGWDPSYGSLYFFNPSKVRPGNYVWSRPVVRTIGNHVFAR